jgi:ankyrin repeat protein
VVREFLKRGAKVKIVNNKGQTPLSLAAGHLTEETVQLIEKAEADQKDVCYDVMIINM